MNLINYECLRDPLSGGSFFDEINGGGPYGTGRPIEFRKALQIQEVVTLANGSLIYSAVGVALMGPAVGTYIPGAADTRGENSVCVCFLKEKKG